MADPNEITVSELLRLIGTPECPAIADISIDPDFEADPYLIPGAFRHPHTDAEGLVRRLGGRRCIVSCQKGLKLSQGLAARLRCDGIDAQYLQGGMFGWRDHINAPRVPSAALPDQTTDHPLWVTGHKPNAQRIACIWLIRRFVDQYARFLFVSPSEVADVADRFEATPFDIEGVFWIHCGDLCTFDTMLNGLELRTEALDRMSRVVRGSDAEAPGVLAIMRGMALQHRTDLAYVEAALPLFDALYRWARDGTKSSEGRTQ